MVETYERILGFKVVEIPSPDGNQIIEVYGKHGLPIATHRMWLIDDDEVQEILSNNNLPDNLRIYAEYMECNYPRHGLGQALWVYSELHFFFKQTQPYYRFMQDISYDKGGMSPNGWTSRHIYEVLRQLELGGIPITPLWQGKSKAQLPTWIFLFRK